MQDSFSKIEKILSEAEYPKAPAGIYSRTMFLIKSRQKKEAEIKAAISLFVAAVSAVSLYIFSIAAVSELYTKGTIQIFSLVFSDFRLVAANSGDYFLSLMESLPALQIVYALFFILCFFVSVVFAANNFKSAVNNKIKYVLKNS